MKELIKNYKMPLVLLFSILIGGVVGIVFGEKAAVLQPFGDIYLNLMFTLIVPLVFFSVASAVSNMGEMNRLGKIIINIVVVFLVTGLISGILAIIGALIFNPTKGLNVANFKNIISEMGGQSANQSGVLTLPQQLVKTITVGDFSELFSKNNMLQIIIFSVLFGISTALVGEKAKAVKTFLDAAASILLKMVSIIMYYAPIGLGCYFATVVGQLGTQILHGYVKVFVLYLVLTAICYFVLFSIYSYLSAGRLGFKTFWQNAIAPTVTALATCSSAASIPVNLEATKKIGVPSDIAETVIPLGVNIHKDGSVMGGVLKIVFLFGLFGRQVNSPSTLISILVMGFLVGAVMGAIPGGGMIGEMLIISVYGFKPEVLPIIAVISTIIDAPATLLNSTGNTVCAMLISRFVDGKDWLNSKKSNHISENEGENKCEYNL